MNFPHLNYQILYSKHFKNWDEYVAAINKSEQYCKQISNINEFEGYCKATDLPAFHPYWHNKSKLKMIESLELLKIKYNKCLKDVSIVAILFNKSTSLLDIVKLINDSQTDIDKY